MSTSADADRSSLRDVISDHLGRGGFAVQEAEVAGYSAQVARRSHFQWFTLTRLYLFVFLIDVPRLDDVVAQELLDAARAWAIAEKPGLRPGWQTGVGNVVVLMSDNCDPGAKTWASRNSSQARMAVLDLGVVVDKTAGDATYPSRTPIWGVAYGLILRRIVRRYVLPVVKRPSGGAAAS